MGQTPVRIESWSWDPFPPQESSPLPDSSNEAMTNSSHPFLSKCLGLAIVIPFFSSHLFAQIGGGWENFATLDHSLSDWPVSWGSSLSSSGDGDFDGNPDIVIGDPTGSSNGIVALYHGNGALLWEMYGRDANGGPSMFGHSVAGLVDGNVDLWEDVLVGAPGEDQSGNMGRAYLYSGNIPPGQPPILLWSQVAPASALAFGWSVAFFGDEKPNLDCGALLAIGDPFASNSGTVWIYGPYCGGFSNTLVGPFFDEAFGWSLSSAGDLDGDGNAELLIGAPNHLGPNDNTGCVYLFDHLGNLIRRYCGQGFEDEFGYSVTTIEDVDGDGINEHVVGSPEYGRLDGGTVFVYSGRTGSQLWEFSSGYSGDRLGHSVAAAGDVNGDGIPDLIAGAPLASPRSRLGAGYAYILSGIDGALIGRIDGGTSGENLGTAVAGGFDINFDSMADLAVGAPAKRPGQVYAYGGYKPFLQPSSATLSAATGGNIQYQLDFPESADSFIYKILISGSGTGPIFAGDLAIPLTYDQWVALSYLDLLPGFVSNFSGILNGQGDASGVLAPGPLPSSQIGRTYYLAAIAGFPWGPWELASIGVRLEITP